MPCHTLNHRRRLATLTLLCLALVSACTSRLATDTDPRRAQAEQLEAYAKEAFDSDAPDAAIAAYLEAIPLRRALGDELEEGIASYQLGYVYRSQRRYAEAQAMFERSLSIDQMLDDEEGEMASRRALGALHEVMGQPVRALPHYQAALELAQRLQDQDSEAQSLAEIAFVQEKLGQYDDALRHYQQALALTPATDQAAYSVLLHDVGRLHRYLGHYALAADSLTRSLALDQALGDTRSAGRSHYTLGRLYRLLGQPQQARAHYLQALAHARTHDDPLGIGNSLSGLGNLALEQGDYERARDYHGQGLAVRQALGDRLGEGGSQQMLGLISLYAGDATQAETYFRKALMLAHETGNLANEGTALAAIGQLYARDGRPGEALPYAVQALQRADQTGLPEQQWLSNARMQQLLEQLDRPQEAVLYGKRAINHIQQLRYHARTLDDRLQETLLADKRSVYTRLADLLISQGLLAEAEQVLALLKADEFRAFTRSGAADDDQAQVTLTATEAPWMARYDTISSELATLGREYAQLSRVPRQQRTEQEQARYTALQADLNIARQAYQVYMDDLHRSFASLTPERLMAFAQQDLDSLRTLQATLRRLGSNAALVHYLVTPDRLRILVTTADIQLFRDSNVSEAELNRMILAYRQVLQHPGSDPLSPAKALYDALIRPIRDDLARAGTDTLMLSLDANLRYLPMAALHSGERWLMEDFALAIYTPAARTHLTTTPIADWEVAALGVSDAAPGFSALPAVPFELRAIAEDAGHDHSHGVMPGSIRLNSAFDRDTLTELLEAGYPVVHIASHFHFRPGTEADSYLLLGGAQRLTLAEFRLGAFPLDQVDLLTLSACDTAVGSADTDGREVEGFAVLAQRQGARSVMATLWAVADASTGLLMAEFYRLRSEQGMNKAEALRGAQQALQTGRTDTASLPADVARGLRQPERASAQPGFTHPYYWAPFVLMGNWL